MIDALAAAAVPVLLVGGLSAPAFGAGDPPAFGAASPAGGVVTGSLLPVPPGAAVTGSLLPVPAGAVSVTAVDVSPLGVVAGTAEGRPQRWAKLPGAGWLRQPLALPAGATAGTVTGVSDLGETAGSVTVDGASRAVRWTVSGFSSTLVPGTRADAVGPRGTLGVSTVATEPAAESDLVARDGSRTPLRDTPELEGGYRRTVSSVGGPGTAVVWVTDGIGKGTTARPVLWRDGATLRLPVFSSFFLSGACVTRVLPDGTVVFSGYNNDNGTISYDLVKHTGGVPGSSVLLARATPAGGTIAGLTCDSAQSPLNALAPDGGFTGQAAQQAAYWTPAGEGKSIPYAEGERSSTGVAAASGGRVIVRAERSDGSVGYSLWRNGVSTPLAAPAGWSISNVVELTDAGLLVANVRNEAGTLRPAAWRL